MIRDRQHGQTIELNRIQVSILATDYKCYQILLATIAG